MNVADLPLSPDEAFVWSQLDGRTTPEEVCELTGLESLEVLAALERLFQLGAIAGYESARQQTGTRRRDPRRELTEPPPKALTVPPLPTQPAPPPVPEAIDLDDAQRARIDAMFEQLTVASHYELLGVDERADKAAVKKAYFERITFFHPDKYFRKSLGDYKRKLEKIFQQLTEASDTLSRKGTRAAYDEYLSARRGTRALDRVLSSIPPPPPRTEPPPSAAVEAEAEPVAVPPPLSTEERARQLSRKLAGRASSAAEEPKKIDVSTEQAAAVLERFVASRRAPQVAKFVQAGKDAMAEGSWVSAVNALRIALSLAPDDEEARALYEQADARAAQILAKNYETRARYEEHNKNWADAAASWERVAAARPDDVQVHVRIADCHGQSDAPKRGIFAARRATALSPDDVAARLTLATLYERCDMRASAVAEAKRGLEAHPTHAELGALLKRLERGA